VENTFVLGMAITIIILLVAFLMISKKVFQQWYTEAVAEFYFAVPISIIGFIGLGFIAMNPESTGGGLFFAVMAFGGGWVAYKDYKSDDWGATQISEESDGWMLAYQDHLSSDDRRWAVIIEIDGVNHCVDKAGNLREENYFFEDKEDAVNALKKATDPLNDVQLAESSSKKAKKFGWMGLRVGKTAVYLVVFAILGFLLVAFIAGVGVELLNEEPDPRIANVNQPSQNTFEVTIQNSGGSGPVEVKLYWIPESQSYPAGNYPENPEQEGFELYRTRTVQFNSGERRSVSITGEIPHGYDKYYFKVREATEQNGD